MRRSTQLSILGPIGIALAVCGCGAGSTGAPANRKESPANGSASAAPIAKRAAPIESPDLVAPAAPDPGAPRVVFLGDSLTAGYGLSGDDAYPVRVGTLLAERGLSVRIINAGVSGDTTAGGLTRLDWLLAQEPAILFLCLGGNDGLRGLPLEATEANLRAIIVRSKASGATVVLAGMQLPPNYGPEYTAAFRAIFPRLAKELGLPFVPFLLEGVAADPALNQADGIHPNAKGQKIVAETVAKALEPLLRGNVRAAS